MKKRITYQNGQKIGNCTYLNEMSPYINKNGTKERRALFLCKCGNKFESCITSIKAGNTKSCGCYRNHLLAKRSRTHGFSYHPLYNLWSSIKTRCYKDNDPRYKYYGARGISICKEWINNPSLFFEYVSNLPGFGEPRLTLDRINNDGNYEPGNIRWATKKIQSENQRSLRSNNSTGFAFVGPIKRSNQFRVRIRGKHIGTYNNIRDAVDARDKYLQHPSNSYSF